MRVVSDQVLNMSSTGHPDPNRSSGASPRASDNVGDPRQPSTLILHSTSSGYSGTTRIAWFLAHGFADLGHRVTLVFVDDEPSNLPLTDQRPEITVRYLSGPLTRGFSKALQAPVLRIFEEGAFDIDDSVDFIRQLVDSSLKELTEASDYVILMNPWCAFSLPFHPRPRRARIALFFHEPPLFRELPLPLRTVLRVYVERACRAVDLVVSISPAIQRSLAANMGIQSESLMFAVARGKVSSVKDNFVLANTRWTSERDPSFVADIARLVPGVRFIVAGRFSNDGLRGELERKLAEQGITNQVEVRPNVSEEELTTLFSKARCYIRWSAVHGEQGTSLGLFQAIGAGCIPVVSENLGSALEVRQEISGDLVVPRTSEGFAAIITRIMHDEALFNVLQDRVLSYREAHPWRRYAEELEHRLDSVRIGTASAFRR